MVIASHMKCEMVILALTWLALFADLGDTPQSYLKQANRVGSGQTDYGSDKAAQEPLFTPQLVPWTLPVGLPTFGERTATSIQVLLFGGVKRPGTYHLSKEANVRDAILAAQGLTDFANWKGSAISREIPGGSRLIHRFLGPRDVENAILLRDGDCIRIEPRRE
jgi:hypothetical protein